VTLYLIAVWWIVGVLVTVAVIREDGDLLVRHIPEVAFFAFVWPVWWLVEFAGWISRLSLGKKVVLRKKVSC